MRKKISAILAEAQAYAIARSTMLERLSLVAGVIVVGI